MTEIRDCQLELEALCAVLWPPQDPTAEPLPRTLPAAPLDDQKLIEMMSKSASGPEIDALLRGDPAARNGDRSGDDLSLCIHFAWWTNGDAAQMDRVFRCSGRMREKWDEKHFADGRTYGQVTIEKAITQNGGKGYSGSGEKQKPAKQKPAAEVVVTPNAPARAYDCSDDGNAQRLIRQHGDKVRYLPGEEKWLIWDGRRWKRDDAHQIENLAAEALRTIHHEAGAATSETLAKKLGAWAITSGGAKQRSGALLCARSEPAVVVRREDLDRDPYLLNCLNGTLDLRTAKLRRHRQADALTWLAPVEYRGLDVRDEIFEKVLHDATGGDQEFQRWLQRYAGMSLVGEMTELVLILLGGTETGKSTLTGALTATLGEGNYALTGNQEALLQTSNTGGPRGSVMAFEGRRLVTIPEFDPAKTLDEPLLKTLTGERTFQGRELYKNDHAMQPISKLWLHTNHMPKVSVEDASLWRRLRVAPFVCRPTRIDETIKPYLTDPEQAGGAILAWALRGCLDWQAAGGGKDGLGECAIVDKATAALRMKMDPLADFFDDCCVFEPDAFSVTADIRVKYGFWADLNNVPKTRRKGDKVRSAGLRLRGASDAGGDGFSTVEGRQVRGWTGVRLVDPAQGSLL